MQITEIRVEAGEALEAFTAMTTVALKLQEVAYFRMFFHMMQTIHFIHVCILIKKWGHAVMNRVIQ